MDFVRSYCAEYPTRRKETPLFRAFKYSEIVGRDKANLDFQWQVESAKPIQKESSQFLMKEIIKDLEEAMREFAAAESALQPKF